MNSSYAWWVGRLYRWTISRTWYLNPRIWSRPLQLLSAGREPDFVCQSFSASLCSYKIINHCQHLIPDGIHGVWKRCLFIAKHHGPLTLKMLVMHTVCFVLMSCCFVRKGLSAHNILCFPTLPQTSIHAAMTITISYLSYHYVSLVWLGRD